KRPVVLTAFIWLTAVSVALAPQLTRFSMFVVMQSLFGFFASGIDCGSNAWIMDIWKSESGPFLQGMHFAYAAGSMISPLIAEPFLATMMSSNVTTNGTVVGTTQIPKTETQIHYPYTIVASFLAVAGLMVVVLSLKKLAIKESPESDL